MKLRKEFDSIGSINVPNDKYWGASTQRSKKYYETEASGNINLKTVKSIAATGVDRISVGSITHSVVGIDLKLEF